MEKDIILTALVSYKIYCLGQLEKNKNKRIINLYLKELQKINTTIKYVRKELWNGKKANSYITCIYNSWF